MLTLCYKGYPVYRVDVPGVPTYIVHTALFNHRKGIKGLERVQRCNSTWYKFKVYGDAIEYLDWISEYVKKEAQREQHTTRTDPLLCQ